MSLSRSSRSILTLTLVGACLAGSPAAIAQALEVPAPSAKAKVEQRVGITDFSIDYSSPGVKGRKIWGGLVPYGELWRTGANAATKLVASRDFNFGGQAVPAGTYSLLSIPTESTWTVILNKNPGGTTGYDQKDDVARITVTPAAAGHRERMTFLFSDTADDSARLDLEWEKLRVSVPIKTDTKAQMTASIDKSLGDAWRPHFLAGRYLFDSGGDLNAAVGYLDTSISIKPTWWNHWIKAQALAKLGRSSEAVASAQKAQDLGKGDNTFENFFKQDVQKAVEDWKKSKS